MKLKQKKKKCLLFLLAFKNEQRNFFSRFSRKLFVDKQNGTFSETLFEFFLFS